MANRRPPGGPGRGPNTSGRGPKGARPQRQRPPARHGEDREHDQPGGLERLQKVLAHAGIGSRRACEDVILQGRVTVDGQVVRELGTKVDPHHAKVAVDGQAIHLERMVYYAVSKPKGYVSTNNDPAGRPRVVDLLPEIPQRVYTVGRLDEMSTGLILLTNDGELANRLAHPKYGVEKLYRVVVAGTPGREVLDKLVEGVWLAEGKVRARRVRAVGKKGQATVLEMVLAEGKNREVRRMLAKLGHKVMSLTRVAVGPVTLKGLAPGQYRPLSHAEVELLRKVAAGIAVPLPRFSERRPQRASNRPRPSGTPDGPRDRPAAVGHAGSGPRPPRRRDGAPAQSGGPRRTARPPAKPGGKPGSTRRPTSADAGAGQSGSRLVRPEGLPPSQRRPSGQRPAGPPRRPAPPADAPPSRRIIGLDTGPAREGPPRARRKPAVAKRRPPRSSLGPRAPRPKDDDGG